MNEPPKPKSRIFKWLFIGCGGLLLLVLVVCGGGGFLLLQGIKSSESYVKSKEFIASNGAVREELGDVKDWGFLPAGHQNVTNGAGDASWKIEVTGSKSTGRVVVNLTQPRGGAWMIDEAYLIVGSQERRIDAPDDWGPIQHDVKSSGSSSWDD